MDMANQLCYKEEIVSVKLPPAKLNCLRAPYRYAVQGKVLFKKVRIDHLYNHLVRTWSLEGTIKIHELANDFFVIVFSHPIDFLKVFWNGPWKIAGHYITLQPFAFNFKPLEASITTTPIWVRLPELPAELYDTEVFGLIAEALGGSLVKTHSVTEERVRMKFAQLCIELDVSKPLPRCVEIGGLMQRIEYVGLHLICGICRRAGHSRKDCPFYHPQPDLASQASFEYGPWFRAANSEERRVLEGVAGSHVPFIQSVYSDGSSGSSSDLIREASTRYLQPGEGTSSSVTKDLQSPEFLKEAIDWNFQSGKTPMAEESSDLSDTWKESKARNAKATVAKVQHLKEVTIPFQANSSEINSISENPLEKEASVAVQTAYIQNNSCHQGRTGHLNPFSPPFQLKGFEADLATQFYAEYVKKSASHKAINAKSILVIEQSNEPVILSTTEEVSSIHASLSISPLTSGKAWIKVTPNVPDQDIQSILTNSPRKMLCWTCWGADDTKVAKAIDELIATHNPSILFLSQMGTAGHETCQVISDSKFSGSFYVNPVGYMGGMWLLWRKEEIKVDIESATLTHIKATVYLSGEDQV